MIVFFRCDASSDIGIGHFSRCLILADAFSDRGVQCHFICSVSSRGTIGKFGDRYPVSFIDGYDAADTVRILLEKSKTRYRLIVIDHYGLDSSWLSEVKPNCNATLLIDDNSGRSLETDWLVDTNPGLTEELASKYYSSGARFFCGSRYALISQQFVRMRRPNSGCIQGTPRILINLGGGDPADLLLELIPALSLRSDFEVEFLLPETLNNYSLKKRLCHENGVPYISFSRSLADIYNRFDIVVGAAGVSSLERLAQGIPTVTVCLVDNQDEIFKSLNEKGLVWAAKKDSRSIISGIDKLINDTELRNRLIKSGLEEVDGMGASRVVHSVLSDIEESSRGN
ncbi:MAG: UDP-2,4-diacetamido-2,4,6-trideoxy-beta-L-altropyranose hydrolase [Saccharospirillaceae bacterium]|nr:hypothetical protein A3759_02680 [Thalassolituus sp. HI0120]MCH2040766.1 UDP-2,4-diacetamido-2,4,6-trideoxy-beta-L-altropyranose hydrolase [Saccharospirillaceae bacterium]